MKAILPICVFLAAVLIASPVFANPGDPMQGTEVGLEHDPGRVVTSQTKTNSAGVAVFQNVKPGKYRLTVYVAGASGGVWKTENKSPRPPVVIEVKVPGQATFKIAENESPRPADRSRITAIAVDPSDPSGNRLLVPFTVTGNEVRAVTVTVTQGSK